MAFGDLERALAGVSAAILQGSGQVLDDLGITVSTRDTLVRHAQAHRPHLLRSKKKRQRKKAIKRLRWLVPAAEQRLAFQRAILERIGNG